MIRIGLKLWSLSPKYIPAAEALYNKGVFDYLELFTAPDSVNTVKDWKALKVPFVLHAPHSYAGLNLADKTQRDKNMELVCQVGEFFDALDPSWVIFHPGIQHDAEEAIFQMSEFKRKFSRMQKKILVENKPGLGLNGETCLGASPEQTKYFLRETGAGFCFDIGHAICYAVFSKKPWKQVVEEFLRMEPAMFHLSDGKYSEKDMHMHLGQGQLEIGNIAEGLPSEAMVTLETPKDFPDRLDDFVNDVETLKRYVRN